MPGALTLSTTMVVGWQHLPSFYLKRNPFASAGVGRAGRALGGHYHCGDSSLPLVSEGRGGRANELMSAKCFEDEKTFSCVLHCSY